MEAAKEDPSVLLSFLDDCLGAVAGAGAPAQLVSPSAFTLLRKVAMLVAQAYLEATGGELSTNAKPTNALTKLSFLESTCTPGHRPGYSAW